MWKRKVGLDRSNRLPEIMENGKLSRRHIIPDHKRLVLLGGCLVDSTLLPPFSVENLKSTDALASIFTNDISFAFIGELFKQEAWETLQARITEKKEKELYSCNSCLDRDNGEYKMVECEGCLEWYHYHCVSLRTHSKPKKWFCQDCWV